MHRAPTRTTILCQSVEVMPTAFRTVFRAGAGAAVSCALITGCSFDPLDTSEIKPEFSCTDKGVARNLEIAKEVSDVVDPGLVTSTANSHGCDSGTNGYYDFDKAAKPIIIDRFDCRVDHLGVSDNGMRCRAKSGDFALYSVKDDNVVSIEAQP